MHRGGPWGTVVRWRSTSCTVCVCVCVCVRVRAYTGVPPSQREEIWEFLSNLYQARNKEEWQYPGELCGREAFRRLSQQSTEYEHSIQIDLSKVAFF